MVSLLSNILNIMLCFTCCNLGCLIVLRRLIFLQDVHSKYKFLHGVIYTIFNTAAIIKLLLSVTHLNISNPLEVSVKNITYIYFPVQSLTKPPPARTAMDVLDNKPHLKKRGSKSRSKKPKSLGEYVKLYLFTFGL